MMIGLPTVPPIGELRQIPFDFHHPGQSTAVVRRSMELFAERVLPVLKTF